MNSAAFVVACLMLAINCLLCSSWILPVSRLPPIAVPSLPDLKAKITQIRNFQWMMDRMEYDDDIRVPIAVKVPVTATPLVLAGNETASHQSAYSLAPAQVLASPQLEVPGLGGMPALPNRSPQSEFVNKLVVIDVPRSIIQSMRTFSNWFDRMISGWID